MLTGLTYSVEATRPRPLPHVQPPMVYVYETQAWEYKVVVKIAATEEMPSEQEINALGESGWELAGVVPLPDKLHFYFKRIRK
jgi:hypothetical protein